jgi:hypothetical protein
LNFQKGFHYRTIKDLFTVSETLRYLKIIFRGVFDSAGIESVIKGGRFFSVNVVETFHVAIDAIRHKRDYVRELSDSLRIQSEVKKGVTFFIKLSDSVHAVGSAFRSLLITIKILTSSIVRDYVIQRFLVSKKEIIIKSIITIKLSLESKFN